MARWRSTLISTICAHIYTENESEIQSFELEAPNNDAQEQEQTPVKERTSKSVNKKCSKKSKKDVTETWKPLVNIENKTTNESDRPRRCKKAKKELLNDYFYY